jgi:hypothetical protein
MFRQIHTQNQLLLHLVHEILRQVYRIQHVDPMPIQYTNSISKSYS